MMVERHPFLIGYQGGAEEDSEKKPVVSIDMDNPRVSEEEEGEVLFEETGQPTEFLKDVMGKLEALHQGHEHNKALSQLSLVLDYLSRLHWKLPLIMDQLINYWVSTLSMNKSSMNLMAKVWGD